MFAHEDAVYGLSVSPVDDNVFASSSDDGRVLIWDIRESSQGGENYICMILSIDLLHWGQMALNKYVNIWGDGRTKIPRKTRHGISFIFQTKENLGKTEKNAMKCFLL